MRKNKLVPKNMHDERSVAQNDGTLVASMRASILPLPDEIERYEAICPGTLKTLLSTYEKQTDHRIEMESAVVNNDIKEFTVWTGFRIHNRDDCHRGRNCYDMP